eukprot:EG_transcript_3710
MPRDCFRFWRLAGEVEHAFEESRQGEVARTFNVWCVVVMLLCVGPIVAQVVMLCHIGTGWPSLVLFSVMLAYCAALLVVRNCTAAGRRRTSLFLHTSCMLIVACSAGFVQLNLQDRVVAILEGPMKEVWSTLATQPESLIALRTFAESAAFGDLCWSTLLTQHLLLDALRLTGSSRFGLVLHFMPMVIYIPLSFAVGLNPIQLANLLLLAGLASLYSFLTHLHMISMLRREFWLNRQLQQSLSKEAEVAGRAREAEAAHKEAALKADTILNHILKNIMADARGCIDMYLEGQPPLAAHLERGRECLTRGMHWCKRRAALLRIASGDYQPVLVSTDLQEFGKTLVSGRRVRTDIPQLTVKLDPVLCDLVLDNALSNALHHGHPEDPDVTLSVCSYALPVHCGTGTGVEGVCQGVTFRVTNRAHPAGTAITPNFLAERLAGEKAKTPMSWLSDGLGLPHLFLAATMHDIQLSLRQENDLVVFEATLAVDFGTDPCPGVVCEGEGGSTTPLPGTVRIFCLDDSDIARRLMLHSLQTHLPEAEARVFGSTYEDIEEFCSLALKEAEVVVLDQHLQYDGAIVYGTDLISRLVNDGFQGFVVVRSANSDRPSRAQYEACGAHLTIGKDVPGREMVHLLRVNYRQFLKVRGSAVPLVVDTQPVSPSSEALKLAQAAFSWVAHPGPSSATSSPVSPPCSPHHQLLSESCEAEPLEERSSFRVTMPLAPGMSGAAEGSLHDGLFPRSTAFCVGGLFDSFCPPH